MELNQLRGCGTALVTPFQAGGALDAHGLRGLVRRQVDEGIEFLVPCGTTGESPVLDAEEHARVVEITLEEARGKVPVIAGAGGNNTRRVCEQVRRMESLGVDGILSVSPYYNKPTQEGIFQHYRAVAKATTLPVIVYNVPGRTGSNIEPATLVRLAEIPNILGVKEASGNIVQICDHLGWPGSRMHGVKRLFAWMIPRFDQSRFNVSLISLRKKDLSADTLEEFGIDVTYMGRHKFDPGTYPALLKVLRDRKADILHMHGYGATTFGRLCAWRMGIPSILHEHANHGNTPWFQKIADKLLAPHTDIAIAVSESTGKFTTRARLMPAERTKVVYLGAPLDEFARPRSADEIAVARSAMGILPGTTAIGTITRLMPSKGNQYLVDVAPNVLAAHPRVRFFIVGEGELQPALEAQARALGLGDRLVFTGYMRDVAAALSALDLVVFPSLWEGTPLTVFEALAMGKPIVATDADGLVDVLTDRKDALIVPKANAELLAGAINHLLETPALAAALSTEARKTGARYDIAAFVRKMERLYELLHEASRVPGRAGILKTDLSFLATERR